VARERFVFVATCKGQKAIDAKRPRRRSEMKAGARTGTAAPGFLFLHLPSESSSTSPVADDVVR
jgi:hypothetical protein